MPVNSFEDYPMTWIVQRNRLKTPIYKSLAKALEEDIENGVLAPNTKLPPQRELADYLDINLSTVTRAFKLCEMKGLLYGTVGKGTFVSSHRPKPVNSTTSVDNHSIDFGQIRPFYQLNQRVLEVANDILQQTSANQLFEFMTLDKEYRYKRAAKKWLEQFHLPISENNIIITSGTQNAFVIALISLFQAGDKIAVDSFSYPNFIKLARQLNIQLIAVDGDEQGMNPQSLEMCCKNNHIKGIYLVPSCNNPTAITMPQLRRDEIATILNRHKLILIEDDTYSFLVPDLVPISCSVEERFVYISGTSKALCPGLRVAYMAVSEQLKEAVVSGMHHVNLQIPLLNLEILTTIIESETKDYLISTRLRLAKERNEIFQDYFALPKGANPLSYFQWITLPTHCNGYNFELQAKKADLLVFCSDRFVVGPHTSNHAVRVSLCSVDTVADLEKGLAILKKLIEENSFTGEENTLIV